MTLHSLQRKLAGFDIYKEVEETVVETAGDIAELNRGQMAIGRRADASEITPTYSDLTIELKQAKGQETEWVTLRDTGSFWSRIFVDVNAGSFTISSSDDKTGKLEKKYGEKIFGLTKESRTEEYIPLYFFPALKAKITKKLGFKFS
jgi:hypothetical protein